jgi:hypothetical protein
MSTVIIAAAIRTDDLSALRIVFIQFLPFHGREWFPHLSTRFQSHYSFDMFKLVFFVPKDHVEEVKVAVFEAGAGKYEKYDSCSWQSEGTGQFRPLSDSDPFIGSSGVVEHVREYRVEVLCRDEVVRPAITALLSAHPYEEVAYEVYEVWQQTNLPNRIP